MGRIIARGASRILLLAILAGSGCSAPPLLFEGLNEPMVEPLHVQVVRLSSEGISPKGPIRVPADQGSVLFVNDTTDRVVSLSFGDGLSELSCTYTSGIVASALGTRSEDPIAPGGAASLCVHAEPGTIQLTVTGLNEEPFVVDIQIGGGQS